MENNNPKKSHSFYKEQQKSIFGQQQWTGKRIGKLCMTILKWLVYGFLIIATLWGCVNEFIIQTSNNLGQGVEFYQKDDFVYPNTYNSYNVVGYTATNEAVEEGIAHGGSTVVDENGNNSQAIPFNFNVINPNFGITLEEGVDSTLVNTEDIMVKAYEVTDSKGNLKMPAYTYNLNELTQFAGLSLLTYDWSTSVTTDAGDGFDVVMRSVPTAVKDKANENIESANLTDDYKYSVSTPTDLIFYMLDSKDGIDGVAIRDTNYIEWEPIERGFVGWKSSVINSKVGLIPDTEKIHSIDDALVLENYFVVPKLELNSKENSELIKAQAFREVNKYAFLNGSGKSSFSELPQEAKDIYINAGSEFGLTETDFTYSVDYTKAKPDDAIVYGGAQVFVAPISKGFPVSINEQGQKLIDENFRTENWNNWDTSKTQHDEGFDVENQMYGWTLLDGTSQNADNNYQADVLRIYKDATEAAEGNVYSSTDENDFFYADQRRMGWGLAQESDALVKEGYGNVEVDGTLYSVFDEKIKSWMNDTVYLHKEVGSTILFDEPRKIMTWDPSKNTYVEGESISYGYATEFAGMTSLTQITATEPTITLSRKETTTFVGTLPMYVQGTFDGTSTIVERSALSDSAASAGQDSWGESRVTFIGLEDWGKAWEVQYGPLYGAFVFPLAHIAMFIGEIFNYAASAWGTLFSIIVLVFLTRGLGALLSIKGTSNQMKMQEVQTDVAKIKAKYAKYDLKAEPRMKQKQQAEIMALYRKKEINPMGSLGTIFITMPIFISLWIIISSLPAYKIVFMGNFSWAVSAWYGIFNLGFIMLPLYLMVGISVGLVQGVSSKVPTWLANKRKGIKRIDEATKAAAKKQNKTQNIMIGVFVFMGLTVPALFAFYWICSGFFTIILELVKHAYKVNVANKKKLNPQYQSFFERRAK